MYSHTRFKKRSAAAFQLERSPRRGAQPSQGSTMSSYTMGGMFAQGKVRNPGGKLMDGAKYVHVYEDNAGNKHGNWVDAEGRTAGEREAHKKQVEFMSSAGKSKYPADKDFLDSYNMSDKNCNTFHRDSTMNEINITQIKGEIAGFGKTVKASEYRMQSIQNDEKVALAALSIEQSAEEIWDNKQVKENQFKQVSFPNKESMGRYLQYQLEAITYHGAVDSEQTKQTEMDDKISKRKILEGQLFNAQHEREAYVGDWKKRRDGDLSITVAVTKERLAPPKRKRGLERTGSVLMTGEAKELATALVDFFVDKVGVTEANLDNSIESFWRIFDGDEGSNKLVLGQFTQMSQVITDAGQKLTRNDMKHIFQLLDTDNSGTLEKTEFVKEIAAIFHETHGEQSKKQKAASNARAAAFFGTANNNDAT